MLNCMLRYSQAVIKTKTVKIFQRIGCNFIFHTYLDTGKQFLDGFNLMELKHTFRNKIFRTSQFVKSDIPYKRIPELHPIDHLTVSIIILQP